MRTYEVIVGNIGSVYSGHNRREADKAYQTYCERSREQDGRAAGESVTLLTDGDITEEYVGTLEVGRE